MSTCWEAGGHKVLSFHRVDARWKNYKPSTNKENLILISYPEEANNSQNQKGIYLNLHRT